MNLSIIGILYNTMLIFLFHILQKVLAIFEYKIFDYQNTSIDTNIIVLCYLVIRLEAISNYWSGNQF